MVNYVGPWRLAEPVPFDPSQRDQWANTVNTNMTLIQAGATGGVSIDLTGLTSYTLTAANGAADQSRPLRQVYTGALTADCTVTMPNVDRLGIAVNATTGGHNVILKAGAGTTGTVPPTGYYYFYASDSGGNVVLPTVGSPGGGAVSFDSIIVTHLCSAAAFQCLSPGYQSTITPASIFTNGALYGSRLIISVGGGFLGTGQFDSTVTASGFIQASDYRLKNVYGIAEEPGAIIDAVPVYDAAFKAAPNVRRPMFLAHELPAWAVHGTKDAVGENGKIIPQGFDTGALISVLWAEVQALRKRVKALEGK